MHLVTKIENHAQEMAHLNVCMLGALVAITAIVRPDSLRKAVLARFGGRGTEANDSALTLGLEMGTGYSWS